VHVTQLQEPPAELIIGALHELLLLLAGRLPDGDLAAARAVLAQGSWQDAVAQLAAAAVAARVPLGKDEVDLLRDALGLAGLDGAAELAELQAADPPEPDWWFLSAAPGPEGYPDGATAPGDLTVPSAGPLDATDRALADAAALEPGVCGVWRAWRVPLQEDPAGPVRVVVVTVDERLTAPERIAARWAELPALAGPTPTMVEVCAAGVPAPRYQTVARCSGTLVWAAEPYVEPMTARVFDTADADGPRFTPDRPRIEDPDLRSDLLDLLDRGEVLLWVDTPMADLLDPDRGAVVPLHFRTDGRWIWTEAVGYYLAEHGVEPDPELLRHLRDTPDAGLRSYGPDEVAMHRVLVHLMAADPAQGVWTVPAGAPGDG
jgi:hypothetical protein